MSQGPKWTNRQDHVSPQALVSVRTININGVEHVTLKGNKFIGNISTGPRWHGGRGNITDNLCMCCTVVDTPREARCVDVTVFA